MELLELITDFWSGCIAELGSSTGDIFAIKMGNVFPSDARITQISLDYNKQ